MEASLNILNGSSNITYVCDIGVLKKENCICDIDVLKEGNTEVISDFLRAVSFIPLLTFKFRLKKSRLSTADFIENSREKEKELRKL